MKLDVMNMEGEKVESREVPASIFEAPIKVDLMHQAYVRQMANSRSGTHKTKSRGEVRGGGRKPWRQKGTGRARHGSIRSPIWVGGGKVHTPRPRDYSLQMPRKMRHAALRSALSAKAQEGQILLLDQLSMEEPKTSQMASVLKKLVGQESVLVLLPDQDTNVELSLRNLPNAKYIRATYLNIRDVLGFDRLIIPLDSLDQIEALFAGGGDQ